MKMLTGKNTFWQRLRRNPILCIGILLVILIFLMAIFPQIFTRMDPYEIVAADKLQGPSAAHIFGTDSYGRDLFTRCVYGTSVDLRIGIIAMIIPLLVGSLLGLIAGYYGGKADVIIMRIVDIMTAFPYMVLVIGIVAILGASLRNLYIAIWLVGWKEYTRLVRSEVLTVKRMAYVDAARTEGFTDMRIIFRQVLPNVISGAIVYGASDVVLCMLSGASLSYLGLGVQPPIPEWGAIISSGKTYITSAWWITVFPGLFLMLSGLAFSFLGDGISEMLRTKGQ